MYIIRFFIVDKLLYKNQRLAVMHRGNNYMMRYRQPLPIQKMTKNIIKAHKMRTRLKSKDYVYGELLTST